MDITYFQKINNTYKSSSRQETDLYLLNKQVDERFADTIDYHVVSKNGLPYELIISRDTEGNTFKKKIKAKHSAPFNLGDYIEWNNQHWLITLIDPDEKVYHSGYMYLCTVPLRWQNSKGKIVERWAYSEDFTRYTSGVAANNTISTGDNQYGLTLPIDEETKQFKRDMRFPIDLDDSERPDIYKLTNRKVNLNNNQYFGRGSNMIITLSYDAFNKDYDKRVTLQDGLSVWIAGYTPSPTTPSNPDPTDPTTPNETANLSATISGNTSLKVGFERSYTVIFNDVDGNVTDDVDFNWNVTSDFDDKIIRSVSGKTIKLKVDDGSLIDESFLLSVTIGGNHVAKVLITLVEGF
jgi:hypothetical protein